MIFKEPAPDCGYKSQTTSPGMCEIHIFASLELHVYIGSPEVMETYTFRHFCVTFVSLLWGGKTFSLSSYDL